ncbi:MAG TPA: DNA polymerase III subunit delta [Acidimicrobiales bacterium]|nr:DNA polymerase III subunit delta [Acidimicrobiales bacterium]
MSEVFPVYLVRGDDPTVTADATRSVVAELVGDLDPSLVVEELSGDDYELAAVVDAAQTPPFFAARRIVVARDVGRFTTQEVAPLVSYIGDPLDSTNLVLVGGGGQLARTLTDAVRKVGHVVEAGVPSGKGRSTWLTARMRQGPVRLDAAASALVQSHLGEDVGRLGALLETLSAAYGEGARISADQLEPFLGRAGSVAPWELTDAIDKADTAAALEHLHRLMGAGGRHALVIMATLHTAYSRMLRLDGAGITDEREAAAALGMTGSTFPAKKALLQTRKLGHEGITRAITLLAEADVALRGTIDWSAELVLEVLVARLSRLAPPARRGR